MHFFSMINSLKFTHYLDSPPVKKVLRKHKEPFFVQIHKFD